MTAWQQAKVIAYDQTASFEEAESQAGMMKALFGGGSKAPAPTVRKR